MQCQRNELCAAFEAAQAVAQQFDPNDPSAEVNAIFDAAGLLEIYSRRESLRGIQRDVMYALFQEAGGRLDECERIFKQTMADVRLAKVAEYA